MDVTSWLLRRTPPRPLLVTAPRGTEARLAVERAVRERGWRPAASPAQANLLVVAGVSESFEPYVRQVWRTVPAPRVRVDVMPGMDVRHELDAALAVLHDVGRQRLETEAAPAEDHHLAPAEHDHPAPAGHDHLDHGGHEHHLAGMEMPGGVPMADRAADRDGLMLDQLHLPLGPALPLWPAGLIVHTRLQGDVIQHASVELLDPGPDTFWSDGDRDEARRLDSCARLLALAGWTDAAVIAQTLRDKALAGTDVSAPAGRWARRVRRSRTLRWLLAGDALDRLHGWLDPGEPDRNETQWTAENLPTLLDGAELATARLIVASLGTHHG